MTFSHIVLAKYIQDSQQNLEDLENLDIWILYPGPEIAWNLSKNKQKPGPKRKKNLAENMNKTSPAI